MKRHCLLMNVAPSLIDPTALIYQASDGPVEHIIVYEGGSRRGLSPGEDVIDLRRGSIPVGKYRTNLARGLFQLGTFPTGIITCDVVELQDGTKGTQHEEDVDSRAEVPETDVCASAADSVTDQFDSNVGRLCTLPLHEWTIRPCDGGVVVGAWMEYGTQRIHKRFFPFTAYPTGEKSVRDRGRSANLDLHALASRLGRLVGKIEYSNKMAWNLAVEISRISLALRLVTCAADLDDERFSVLLAQNEANCREGQAALGAYLDANTKARGTET